MVSNDCDKLVVLICFCHTEQQQINQRPLHQQASQADQLLYVLLRIFRCAAETSANWHLTMHEKYKRCWEKLFF